jgi:hypothetical protein
MACAHEERIGEVPAQLCERLAERGLRLAEHGRLSRDVALAQQHLDCAKMTQIDFHGIPRWNRCNSEVRIVYEPGAA